MISVAFKEWAVICRALAEGRQTVILRKGGIAESGGEFRPEHDRFLLYPTYFHEQQHVGIKAELLPLLDEIEAEKRTAGVVQFTLFADVKSVIHLTDLDGALALSDFHGWTADTVRQRFHYRTPGLFALVVRVYRLPTLHDVIERPEYAGCKSWVPLETAISVDGSIPVLDDSAFANIVATLSNFTSRS
jgi:hypothetical protein